MTTTAPPPPTVHAPTPPALVVPVLKDMLWDRFMTALEIKRRLHVQRAFVDELTRVTRGKYFHIRNDIVWNAMIDVRAMLVTDLYSFTVAMRHGMKPLDPSAGKSREFMAKRGLFIEIRDHHCANLTRTYVAPAGQDSYLTGTYTRSRAERFDRLFPKCTTGSPTPADIDALCEEFRVKMVPLGKDRNKNRAHAHEGSFGQAKTLSNPELDDLFDYVERMLEDLSLVSESSSFGRQDMNDADSKETSVDLVDLILFGSLSEVTRLTTTAKRTRDQLYARLHEIDDNPPPLEPGEEHRQIRFNDRQWAAP